MIIEEKNPIQERREKIEKMLSLLQDIELPKGYELRTNWIYCIKIIDKGHDVASVDFNLKSDEEDNILNISFRDEDQYKKLRKFFEDSKTKFKLIVGGDYY